MERGLLISYTLLTTITIYPLGATPKSRAHEYEPRSACNIADELTCKMSGDVRSHIYCMNVYMTVTDGTSIRSCTLSSSRINGHMPSVVQQQLLRA